MPSEKKSEIVFTPCACRVNGVPSLKCKVCGGSGMVVKIETHQFAFKKIINNETLHAEDAERMVKVTLAMGALMLVLVGIAALAWLVYRTEEANIFVVQMRTGSDIMAPVVWAGMLAASYFIYRVKSEALRVSHLTRALAVPAKVHQARHTEQHTEDMARYFSDSSHYCLKHAYLLARKLGHAQVSAIHLFASCLTDPSVGLLFARLAADKKKLIEMVKHMLAKQAHARPTVMSEEWYRAIGEAFAYAAERKHQQVHPTDLVAAVVAPAYTDNDTILTESDLTYERVEHVAAWVELQRELARRARRFFGRAAYKPAGAMNRAYTSVATPVLDRFSRDLTSLAARGGMPFVVGREREVGEIYRIFQSGERGALLVGAEGAGKSAIIGQIAQAMAAEDAPETMADRRFIELSVPALVAGGGSGGGLEKTLLMMVREIRRAGNVILVIENIHALVGTKSEGGAAFDVSSVLSEELEHGSLTVIASTTPEAVPLVTGSPLGRLLTRIDIGETDRENTLRVLESKAPLFEGRYGVFFSYPALEKINDAAVRYLSDGAMPDKAVRLMGEVGEAVREERGTNTWVSFDDVAAAVSRRTNIPLASITEDERSMLLHLEDRLHERVVDQEEAVMMVANAIRRSRADIRERKRPIASFLFLGPTGVGKTEVARAVAALYFGEETAMIRLDMTEYQGQDALEKLLGNKSAGTTGYLTEAVRLKPFSLILLDEFEKASGETLNLFLQVFEDGRLTDASGRTANFSSAIIVATSNAGAEIILAGLRSGEQIDTIRTRLIQEELPRRFKPELLNRFDGVVVFKPLSVSDVEAITRLILKRIEQELNERGIALKIEEVAVHDLAREGYDPAYGARPLKRLIQERVENPVAEYIVAGNLKHRDVVILEYGGRPRVEKAPPI